MTTSTELTSAKLTKTIYFAGGCFWGTEAYMKKLPGVVATRVGYAKGSPTQEGEPVLGTMEEGPSYQEVCSGTTGLAETVRVDYKADQISLSLLVQAYLTTIDPWSVNRQGNDVGTQYRTAIWWTDAADEEQVKRELLRFSNSNEGTSAMGSARDTALNVLQFLGLRPSHRQLAIELGFLKVFYDAEDYHQNYLELNPGGYCHVNLSQADRFVKEHQLDFDILAKKYQAKTQEELKDSLDELAYEVTQHAATEYAGSSPLDKQFDRGIYVDRCSGEPLFSSRDKFDAGCGWPSFSRPLADTVVNEEVDTSLFDRARIEVRSQQADAHLGHVFGDGPEELGGRRYCINGAALEFIPEAEMESRGYGYLLGSLD